MSQPRSAKGERSRARLVAATAELLQRQGFHATGLAEIVAESGAPRGSLYFYFPGGKEELACTALAEAGAVWRARLEAVIARAPDLPAAVRDVCDVLADELRSSKFSLGCPLATVALEAAHASEAVRRTCAGHYQGWEQSIATRLEAAGVASAQAAELATFALAAIEGALLLAKVRRDTQAVVQTGETLARLLGLVIGAGAGAGATR
jgi:TetR/AcrR family transcriptional repressor of lmrAB and yxaGH operons